MTDIKKINIYMGVVGQAYVDKETAKKTMDAAEKNVLDVKHIIYLINHEYLDDFALSKNPEYNLTAVSYLEEANTTKENAFLAAQFAQRVKQEIINKISLFSQDSTQYAQLMELLNKINENDIDGNLYNGGSERTAEINAAKAEAIIVELNDILEIAQNLLAENIEFYNESVEVYNNAKEIFEAYIPEPEENHNDHSDELEAELLSRLITVSENLAEVNAVTNSINEVNNGYKEEAQSITEDIEVDPEVPQYLYIGTEEINNSNYQELGQRVYVYDPTYQYTITDENRSSVYVLVSNYQTVVSMTTLFGETIKLGFSEIETDIEGHKLYKTDGIISPNVTITINIA